MRRTGLGRFGRVALACVAMALTIAVSPAPAQACIARTPAIYGSSWNGVDVYPGGGLFTCTSGFGLDFQCVELAQRFFWTKGWVGVKTWPVSYAYQMYDVAPGLGLGVQANGAVSGLTWGDLVVWNGTPATGGHVAVVTAVNGSTVTIVEQNGDAANGGTCTRTLTLNGATFADSTVRGVVKGKGSVVPRYNPITPSDSGFARYGTPGGWNNIGGGVYGSGIYTFSNGSARDNYARWTFDLNAINGTRRYKVEAFVTSTHAGTVQAHYHVNTSSGLQYATVNQNVLSNVYANLGSFTLNTGSAWVELDDASGEAGGASAKEIAFDAIKLTPYFTLTYAASAGGTISGTSSQSVISGGNGTGVTAVPASGYHFVKWSDNNTSASRTDTGVGADRTLTATFASNGPTATSITIKTSATTARIGGIPILSGTVTPASMVGKNIVVWVKKPGKAYYSYSSNRTAYSLNGGAAWLYKYYFKPGMTKGVYYFKASAPAPGFASSAGFGTSSSSVITITLR